jgi:hypothetical protein
MFSFATNGTAGSATPAALAIPGSPTQMLRGGARRRKTMRKLRLTRKRLAATKRAKTAKIIRANNK